MSESPNPIISKLAQELGRRGGQKTRDEQRKLDPNYYKRIGKLGGKAKKSKML